MIIKAERRSVTYYLVQAKDLNDAVSKLIAGKGTIAQQNDGGTSFSEVFSIPDLRPMDEVLSGTKDA